MCVCSKGRTLELTQTYLTRSKNIGKGKSTLAYFAAASVTKKHFYSMTQTKFISFHLFVIDSAANKLEA